jgi:hypothetical protein
MEAAAAFNDWTRGEAGLGHVLASLLRLRDKRRYHDVAGSHGDD